MESKYDVPNSKYHAPNSEYNVPKSEYNVLRSEYDVPEYDNRNSEYDVLNSEYETQDYKYDAPVTDYNVHAANSAYNVSELEYEVPKSEYDGPEYDAPKLEYEVLNSEYDVSYSEYEIPDSDNDGQKSENDTLDSEENTPEFEHDALDSEHETPESEHDALDFEHNAPEPEHDVQDYENDAPDSVYNVPDWLKYQNISVGQNCSSELRLFSKSSNRPIVALSSFPGSGNTWARHLLHMASGYWSGNSRDMPANNHLVRAGWEAENIDCKSRQTLVQKTHQWHGANVRCNFEKSIIIMRNPFDAMVSDFKLQNSGSKVSEPNPKVFETDDFHNFAKKYAKRWYTVHYNWIMHNKGISLLWTCFDNLIGRVRTVYCI